MGLAVSPVLIAAPERRGGQEQFSLGRLTRERHR
jgi:hypothetical protein